MNYKNLIIAFTFIASFATAQVRVPRLISDGMVLQRDKPIQIWGWASANENVTISLNNKSYKTTADAKGDWSVNLPSFKAGGPYTMTITASNTITINDILIGDVWICSGQSNMEISMKRVSPLYQKDIDNAENNSIRYFAVPQQYNFNTPEVDLKSGSWVKTTPKNVLAFSAVAYFFAHELYEKYHVPVGLINASLGGSPAEAWLSEDACKQFPVHYNEAQRFKDSTLIKQIEHDDKTRIDAWYKLLRQRDEGYKDSKNPWYSAALNISDWNLMKIPGYWSSGPLGPVNGVVWFRKEVNVTADMIGKPAKLLLGRIIDADSVFVNGVLVGTTGYQYPPRRYEIPSTVLKEGVNTIVVRVISNIGEGGFDLDKPYQLICEGNSIDLKGDWHYKLGATMEPLQGQTFVRWKPVGLYNAMIAPLTKYNMKGVIWYQGESNADDPMEYRSLLPALIRNWRAKWNRGDFPFLYVQLPNFMKASDQPTESNWALMREAQLKTLTLPNTGIAVAIDVGEWNDIHPLNKKDVGKRLALAAQYVAYGDTKTVYAGPIYKSMKVEGNKIVIQFTNIGSGLQFKDGEPKGFAIAGSDNHFVWAKAKIEKNTIVVWNDSISSPVSVRYAWADNPQASLYNKEGLPASPFRTDD
ncbi:MAG TPA: sialate O-acetylesterase [Cyclobacteriaceae bacterium]